MVEVNEAAAAILGLGGAERSDLRIDDLVAPSARAQLEDWWQSLRSGTGQSVVLEHVRSDGSIRRVRFSALPSGSSQLPLISVHDLSGEEDAQREREARLRAAIEAMPDPFAIYPAIRDEEGRIVDFATGYMNAAMAALTGMPGQERTGQGLLERFPAVRTTGLFERYVHVVETGESLALESLTFDDPHAEGGPVQAVLDLRAFRLGDGCAVLARDVSARARAEAALRESEERYRTLVAQSSDAILVLAADGRVTEANPATVMLLGYPIAALVGRAWEELIDPGDLAANALRFAELRAGRSLLFERELRRADGTSVPVELSARMLADGRFLYVARDITERVYAEAERAHLVETLQASQRDLEEAQRIAHVGSWTLDPVTGDATWSTEMYRILGLDPAGPPVGFAEIARLFAPESVVRVSQAVARATASGAPWHLDLEIVRPDGTHGWVASNGIAERSPTGAVMRIRGTMQDITEQHRLEDQLRQAQRLEAVGQLAGGIAHDFNNLLTAIRGYAELLQRSLPASDANRADAEQILLAADRAASLTRQLLAFGRRQVLQPRVLDPADVVAGVAPMLRRLLGEHIELVTHAAPDGGRVEVDPSQFEQVVVNLAVNARDAMPDGGTLTIETSNVELDADYVAVHPEVSPGPYLALTVSDTGTGMDEATKARIFEPFFTTKEQGKGTGMGLATVYGIVKQSGGSIYVYSEPDRGSSFKIYLPRIEEEVAADAGADAPAAAPTGSETILLVEDNEAVRAFATRVLAQQGYVVIQAAQGVEALALAEAGGDMIDLLLTDVIMPGLQGHELAEQLAARQPGLRVLYISGFTENSVIRHGVVDQGIAFLPKPFTAEALSRAVRQALDANI